MIHQWIAIGVTVSIFVLIQFRRSTPLDYLFLLGLLIVSISGILSPVDALAGFANPAVITIAALFALTAGLKVCGVLDWVGEKLLGNVTTEFGAFWRLGVVLVTSSAFLLNTALVAMMAPVVSSWCRKNNIAPSRLLIPVSYFVILGGVCTLIGTSTTLVVNARLQQSHQEQLARLDGMTRELNPDSDDIEQQRKLVRAVRPLGLLELGVAGVPIAIIGGLVLLVSGPRLLPNRKELAEIFEDQRREYLVEMEVKPNCALIGMTVGEARLGKLQGLFVVEIDRDGKPITPVSPEETIEENDRLVFTGLVDTIVELEKIPGLKPPSDRLYEFEPGMTAQRFMTEVVLSRSAPIIGRSVRKSNFREKYDAVIVAVHRNGERLPTRIGDIVFQPGDTLLLQANPAFVERYRNSRDFYLVSSLGESDTGRPKKLPIAAAIMAAMLIWLVIASFFSADNTWTSPAIAALVAVVLFVASGCLRIEQARSALDVQLLVTIACALGLGLALERSGAAETIAVTVVSGIQHPFLLLIAVYVMSMLMTEMITNNAVAALMFPIAVNIAISSGHDPRPFIIAICLASSLAFLTPIGYQTNLMVMGPGGYRPSDFFKAGFPVSIAAAVTAICLIPIFWPFK